MDPAVFAALAGPALAATIEFVSSRINAALDRRPAELGGYEAPLAVDESALTSERLERMRQVAETLSVYRDYPDIVRGDDSRLTRAIALAFADLTEVYKTEFRLDHARDGVSVIQNLGHVGRPVTGIKASGIGKDANVTLTQRAIRVDEGGSLVGLEIEGTIG
ncbi:hypothetical protein [Micromonospora profundi]|uniref:Uncharacterized protein n=1 Tax=Micromonospora profundi TaxID=1420889 RepID=A0AAJ6KYW4_9ACTN|nr:hypothetical protein [Micromonospora profundi]WLS46034.1 hypothetical protein Q3V37_01730 [Micromonospora profundi]